MATATTPSSSSTASLSTTATSPAQLDGGDDLIVLQQQPGGADETDNESSNESGSEDDPLDIGNESDRDDGGEDTAGDSAPTIPISGEENENETDSDSGSENESSTDDLTGAPGSSASGGGGENDSNGGGVIGGLGPSPWEWTKEVLIGIGDQILEEFAAGIDVLHEWSIGIPARGDPGDPDSWDEADDGLWPGFDFVSDVSQFLAMLFLVLYSGVALSEPPTKRRQTLLRIGFALLMVVGTGHIPQAFLHLFNEAVLGIVPSGAEFTRTPGGMAQFAFGIILAGVLLGVSISVLATGLVVIFALNMLTYISTAVWPLSWALWTTRGHAKSFGNLGIYSFGAVLGIAVIQSFMLRALFDIPWSQAPHGPPGAMLGLAGGLLLAFVYIPYNVLQQTYAASSTSLGVSAASQGAKAAKERAIEQYQNSTYVEDSDADNAPPAVRETGRVSNRATQEGYANTGETGTNHDQQRRPIGGIDAQQIDRRKRDRINRGYH